MQIELTHTELETLRHAITTAWHSMTRNVVAEQYAALLDKIEKQAGMRATKLGHPSD